MDPLWAKDVWGAGEGGAVAGEVGGDFVCAGGADPLFEEEVEEGSSGERGGFSSTW